MTYDEKRELRLQISQLLADAGLNQGTIKEMVLKEIQNKTDRAVNQAIARLNAESVSGDYFKEAIAYKIKNNYTFKDEMLKAIRDEMGNRVIQIVLKDCVEAK